MAHERRWLSPIAVAFAASLVAACHPEVYVIDTSDGDDVADDVPGDLAQDVGIDVPSDGPMDASVDVRDASDVGTDVGADVRPDVPIAYSTWDPTWSLPGVSYTNGNLSIASTAAVTVNVRSTVGRATGKWYWEILTTAGDATMNHGGIGVVEGGTPNNINYIGYTAAGSEGMSFGYGNITTIFWNWPGAALHGTVPTFAAVNASTRYMFALDMDTGRLWVGQGGGWYSSGDPSTGAFPLMTGLTGTVYAGVTFYPSSPNAFTANFGRSAFAYAVPTGFNPGLY